MSNNILKLLKLFFIIVLGLLVCPKRLAANKNESVCYLTLPSQDTFSFQCQDQMVKVDSKIYHLDRLRSSLKSNFFEKLFTSGEFKEKNYKVLEIQPKHVEPFPFVVDLIHGKKLIDVLSKENYLTLLEAMDHFEMGIDLEIVSSFIDDNLKLHSPKDAKIFKLYNFIRKNSKFEYLLTSVFKYFSNHLTTVQNHRILSTLPLNHFIRIIRSIEEVDDKKRYKIVQTCTKWLCCDLESRLPRLVILINSIKPGFHSAEESYEDSGTVPECSLRKTNADEQINQKSIAKCVFALLAHGGKLNPTLLRRGDISADHFGLPNWYTYEDQVQQKREEYDEYEQNESPASFVNSNNEYEKLRKFLENGTFHDIAVQVGDKAYKLHRIVLESRCGYFADIFRAEYAEAVAKCDGIPTSPSGEQKYVLDVVDQSSFDAMIDYIYFDKDIRWKFNDTGRVFKTADILKIDSLLEILLMKHWLKDSSKEVNSLEVVEVLGTRRETQYDDLYLLCLCKHLSTKWPEIDNLSQFCSISWSMLKNVLKSPNFRPNDPHKIVDICSTWIIHDVKKRFRLLPRIAQILNPMCVVDQDKYKTEAVVDLTIQSVQFVRDKLWKILSRIPYVIPSEKLSNNRTKRLEEIPMFIISRAKGKTIHVLNVDLDEITSFDIFTSNYPDTPYGWNMKSATMINDNLFILVTSFHAIIFEVYNFSLKKSFLLSFEFDQICHWFYTLWNCNNEIYCCSKDDGVVRKFSMQLNRWMIISKPELNQRSLQFTSDGEVLYRLYEVPGVSNCAVEPYNFEKNVWNRESGLPLEIGKISDRQRDNIVLTVVNGHDFVILIDSKIGLFDHKSMTWHHWDVPHPMSSGSRFARLPLFAQCEDRMVLVAGKLYNFPPLNGSWQLKKELPEYYYNSFVAIHRITTRTPHSIYST